MPALLGHRSHQVGKTLFAYLDGNARQGLGDFFVALFAGRRQYALQGILEKLTGRTLVHDLKARA